jgi:nicotinate-nucleotide--dimethylbenzimidazole phosphoribosyltransferase
MPPTAVPSFAEILKLLPELPSADEDAAAAAGARQAELTKPAGALGRLEEIVAWLAAWQGRHPPRLERPRVAVFAGNHGVTRQGVSIYPPEVTQQMVRNFISGGAAINQLCRLADADLRVYELALEEPTADFTQGPALDEAECARAIAYGMMAVEPGLDLIALGEMGIGNTTSAAALCLILHGGTPEDWTGDGAGVTSESKRRKLAAVAAGAERHRALADDPLRTLAAVGGREMAAILGAILAARLARTPVLLDGYVVTAAASVLHKLAPGLLDHCLAAHVSAEPGHRRLLKLLGRTPLLDLGMRLGEGSGAALAIPVLKAALACHQGMASFAEAGISRG